MSLQHLQKLTWDWGIRCFGEGHMHNRRVRALRMVEEAVEAAQACELDPAVLHLLIDKVYGRPRGDLAQELGGVLLTTSVLATSINVSLEDLYFTELQRCLRYNPEHFANRNQQKISMGLA
jgi:hypothetical protein